MAHMMYWLDKERSEAKKLLDELRAENDQLRKDLEFLKQSNLETAEGYGLDAIGVKLGDLIAIAADISHRGKGKTDVEYRDLLRAALSEARTIAWQKAAEATERLVQWLDDEPGDYDEAKGLLDAARKLASGTEETPEGNRTDG